ncbi:hypothetical protein [Candidatus Electronema sp. PJ]|uniref:hypothetical protein n=1 Tax=Candidatus Electronema sp. PJ TaxID=3401572 RepID=UPI003AA8B09F
MSNVFLGGSRNLARLNSAVRTRLENLITNKHTVLIGDAGGIDKAIQSFFAEENYNDVVVYCMDGKCRHNMGNWQVKVIDSGGKKKDFAYYAMKDTQMSLDADYGFMVWNGESKGTLNNVLNLVQQGKSALVYHSPSREFVQVKTISDINLLVAGCSSELVGYLNKKIRLKKRVALSSQIALSFCQWPNKMLKMHLP